MAFRTLLCTSMALSKKEAFDSCTLPFLLICNQITGWCFPFRLILSKHYDFSLTTPVCCLEGWLTWTISREAARSIAMLPTPAFSISSAHIEISTGKKSLLELYTWEPCNNSYSQQKMTEALGHQKNPYFFQLLCHYLKSLATREHNSTWK